jgi:magnesium-protoporphyrin IX monomethyl ester (oxidative) cyclase
MGKKFRYNSPDYVIRHLEYIIEKFGIKNFHFEDDNISLNKKRFEQILDKIIEKKLKIRWDVPNGLRVDTLNFDLLKKIKRSGGNHLTIAIESGSQDVLDNIIKKKTSLDYILNVIKDCRKLRIKIQAFYVIGFPGETIEQMKETTNLAVRLLKDYQVLPYVGIASPLYGTELYKICVDQGLIKEKLTEKDLSSVTQVYGEPLISTKDFTKRDIKEIIYDFLKKLKKVMIMHAIKHPILALKGLFMVKDQPHVVKQFRKYKVGEK